MCRVVPTERRQGVKLTLCLSSNLAALLFIGGVLPAQELPARVEPRHNQIEATVQVLQGVDSLRVVISNSAEWEVTVNLRDDTTRPWRAITLSAGQTMVLNNAQIISLVTPKRDGGFYDFTYTLAGGIRYVIYWNQDYWDLIREEDQESRR
jgi:hypothetical protein